MKIVSLTLEGGLDPGDNDVLAYATIKRPRGGQHIIVTIDWPDNRSRIHHVAADDRDDQWSMAEGLQETLDGCRGTSSMVHDYFREIERFAD